eukprot:CAMPEP_0176167066 /NCGR_PEP_ID=MMETSP0120_2-20121206/85459_1 /TAXON_ID=160619 /ORGANISM="Kryptoperidinium foliaceum, Strain CCMP 1326" /LENGTH=59 /DNA_ID=CAMNT_0017504651 /DNA_START=21 /DNA_END=196 /DNA_ORIENTATION=-
MNPPADIQLEQMFDESMKISAGTRKQDRGGVERRAKTRSSWPSMDHSSAALPEEIFIGT